MLDVCDIYNPEILGFYSNTNSLSSFSISSDYTYSAHGSGLHIYNIVDPYNPELESVLNPDGGCSSLVVKDNTAFITGYYSINVVDVTNPSNPSIIDEIDLDCINWNSYEYVTINNDNLFLTDQYGRIAIFNISDPNNTDLLMTIDLDGYIRGISFQNNYMFVSHYVFDNSIGVYKLSIVDISNANFPEVVNSLQIPYEKIFIENNQLFIFDYKWNRIHLYNITDEVNPNYEGFLNFNYQVSDISIVQNYFAIMTEYNGIFFFNNLWDVVQNNEDTIIQAENMIKLNSFPNPFNPESSIKFSTQKNCIIKLEVFNVKGQKVKTLTNDQYERGNHTVIWNGTNENDNPVSSGVYFYKLDVNSRTEVVKKCLLLK
jgi:hypothetical protein